MFKYQKWITRDDLQNNPDTLYVFGDNMVRQGFGGLAKEVRGESNAVGIPTKKYPAMNEPSFFTDADLEDFIKEALIDIARLVGHKEMGGDIVWPEDGIGTGLAELKERAPAIWKKVESVRKFLEDE